MVLQAMVTTPFATFPAMAATVPMNAQARRGHPSTATVLRGKILSSSGRDGVDPARLGLGRLAFMGPRRRVARTVPRQANASTVATAVAA